MPDPNSYFSAIMGTVAALYSIFIATFVLVYQSLPKYEQKYRRILSKELGKLREKNVINTGEMDELENKLNKLNNQTHLYNTLFNFLAFLVVIFEVLIGMFFWCISDSIIRGSANILTKIYAKLFSKWYGCFCYSSSKVY